MDDKLRVPDSVAKTHARFLEERDAVADSLETGELTGINASRRLADATDRWIRAVWDAAKADFDVPARLLALGGYGRQELSFGSDVDLVVEVPDEEVFQAESTHRSVERFMAWCREPRVKVSHAVRTPARTRDEFTADYRTAVSYVDARPLDAPGSFDWDGCGASDAFEVLRAEDEGTGFVAELLSGYRQRLERFGKTIFLLEPELKLGKGGLRDLHYVRWAARVRFGFEPADSLDESRGWGEERRNSYLEGLEWLLTLRLHMHRFHGRKHDRLNFPDQERLARLLVKDVADIGEATERLMREHYRHARSSTGLAERMLRRWGQHRGGEATTIDGKWRVAAGQLGRLEDVGPVRDVEVIEALRLASDQGALLDPSLETEIENVVATWGEEQLHDEELNRQFLELLTDPETSERTSLRMLDLGVLTRMIPEFEPLVCHVQHDVYHVYTTDVHSLKCLELARSLVASSSNSAAERWPIFQAIADEIEGERVFLLAALFHDIGKNRGGGHSRKGAAMMTDIGRRLGLESRPIDQLGFLVREHLALSNTARRYDISDSRIIRDLAAKIRTAETLNQLTTLTFCDMSTVGDDVMNDWNASLLTELYRRLRLTIEHGVESLWRGLEEEIQRRRSAVFDLLAERDGIKPGDLRSRLDEFIRDIPASHIVETPPETLARQFQVYDSGRREGGVSVLTTAHVERGSTEVIVSTPDVPGALASITGALSASGLNILAAQIVTTASGRTLDIFQVAQSGGAGHAMSRAQQRPLTDEHRMERLEKRLVDVLEGRESVEELLKRRIAEKRLAPRPTPAVETSVKVLESISDDFTVVEIKAPDRIGLLYEISSTLEKFDVNIHLSKIDALGTQVIDTFYLEDLDGAGLSEEKTAEVVSALRKAIEEPPLRQ